jgi:hypothetical protein
MTPPVGRRGAVTIRRRGGAGADVSAYPLASVRDGGRYRFLISLPVKSYPALERGHKITGRKAPTS